jgi:NhaA family Na+:H+ antiporter
MRRGIARITERTFEAAREFLALESAGGLLLIAAATLAMIVANSPWGEGYHHLLGIPLGLSAGDADLRLSVHHWINDALMAVFFFLVAMEIKREMVEGALSRRDQLVLPVLCAAGGVMAPALIFAALNWNDAAAIRGWAIPTATDIAFAIGVLTLLGSRVPLGLKLLLTTIAVVDDLIAVIIIAAFYSGDLSLPMLGGAGALLAVLVLMNRLGATSIAAYVFIGVIMWFLVLQSGVHATLAGVALGFCIPMRDRQKPEREILHPLEMMLHPWVALGIVPIFAFANAGVPLAGVDASHVVNAMPVGIALGLFVGKQIGIFGVAWLAIRLGLASLPKRTTWTLMYGMAILCGIGFTMSLFIADLSFVRGSENAELSRLGILIGSLLSAVVGYLFLAFGLKRNSSGGDQAIAPRDSKEIS